MAKKKTRLSENPAFWALTAATMITLFVTAGFTLLTSNFLRYLGLEITFWRTLQGLVVIPFVGLLWRGGSK